VDALINRIENLIDLLQIETIMRRVMEQAGLDQYIIRLNTEGEPTSQLFEDGIDSQGRRLEDVRGSFYANFTIQEKIAKGQPTDRITLKDSGQFYKSFRINIDNNGDIDILANPFRGDTNLQSEWGNEIIGLTEENLELLRLRFKEELNKYLTGEIGKV
jgi:hypothetical protein